MYEPERVSEPQTIITLRIMSIICTNDYFVDGSSMVLTLEDASLFLKLKHICIQLLVFNRV